MITSSSQSNTRLISYILQALPSLGETVGPATANDYLPNVFINLGEITGNGVIPFPIMQTVEYSFTKQPPSSSSENITFTQYNGGANPVVPTPQNGASVLNSLVITGSPYGIHYSMKILPSPPRTIGSTIQGISSLFTTSNENSVGGSLKPFLGSSPHGSLHTNLILGGIIVGVIIIGILIVVAIVLSKRRSKKTELGGLNVVG